METALEYAVVTGAAGGMGESLCELFIEKGLGVIGIDQHCARLKALSEKLGEAFIPVEMDLSQEEAWKGLDSVFQRHSNIKSLINLAGVSIGDRLDKLKLYDWQRSLDINVTAPMRLSQMLVPVIAKTGGGSILHVSSPVGLIGARKPSYSASKAALTGLTMSMARNLGRDNIRVNMVLPGTTITNMTEDWSEEKRNAIAEGTHLGRLCEPREFAEALYFFTSDACAYMSGSIIDMTCGGMFGH